ASAHCRAPSLTRSQLMSRSTCSTARPFSAPCVAARRMSGNRISNSRMASPAQKSSGSGTEQLLFQRHLNAFELRAEELHERLAGLLLQRLPVFLVVRTI